jgi:hypothetical protein
VEKKNDRILYTKCLIGAWKFAERIDGCLKKKCFVPSSNPGTAMVTELVQRVFRRGVGMPGIGMAANVLFRIGL